MSGIEESIEKKVVHWISLAEEDLILAKHAFSVRVVSPYRLIAFHAQQCVEKYLKAYLVFHRIDFPYTHNISRLLELCPNRMNWSNKIEEAAWLSQYAVSTRYSDEAEPITELEAVNAVKIAEEVRLIIRSELSNRGVIFPD
jgi:HEPN domain-containing protein